jgi:integrase
LCLLIDTGIRIEEALTLESKNVDLDGIFQMRDWCKHYSVQALLSAGPSNEKRRQVAALQIDTFPNTQLRIAIDSDVA